MDKEKGKDKEGKRVSTVVKQQGYKKLSLTPKKVKDIEVRPTEIKDGKLLFDRNNKDHRYIVEGEE